MALPAYTGLKNTSLFIAMTSVIGWAAYFTATLGKKSLAKVEVLVTKLVNPC